jgi:hypothetical protein
MYLAKWRLPPDAALSSQLLARLAALESHRAVVVFHGLVPLRCAGGAGEGRADVGCAPFACFHIDLQQRASGLKLCEWDLQ